jgi:chloramphenicol 3-O phosphotransferase
VPNTNKLGNIVILNGTPRSGKSNIAALIQNTFEVVWMNVGVDSYMKIDSLFKQRGRMLVIDR